MKIVDFRSDTITKPTEEMRKAMYEAEVGDDVYGEDPTINKLEELAAEKIGKEAALFVPSGTMGNQLALLTHTERGQEIILEENSHIFMFEVGGLAFLSGLQSKIVKGEDGILNSKVIKEAIRSKNIHFPQTGLICLENTHNMAGGVVTPLNRMEEIFKLAQQHRIPVHLDGARIFNASTYLDCDVKDIAKYCDSVMFCLSKGLCAPVGSILAGDKKFIEKAKKFRKLLGGGMRQAGILAAAGIIALEKMTHRLVKDHENLRKLAFGLDDIKGINIDKDKIQTNILMVNLKDTGYNSDSFVYEMKKEGVLATKIDEHTIRFVTHYHIDEKDIEYTLNVIKRILN
ncbi:low-specificity L-threonine aldolase [Thermohalobacter berrensis]|uniref:Threonine aldolase n=1 Tax=Thermohalobacter berrensis TaxID=99594 RepID=A0A419TAW5_9FIRM|nr:low-specificity L-threonine aldolase [Thermohalobacter berrensis]RKD34626.1 threonine aldolase [Thermohalobacter berrensis]